LYIICFQVELVLSKQELYLAAWFVVPHTILLCWVHYSFLYWYINTNTKSSD